VEYVELRDDDKVPGHRYLAINPSLHHELLRSRLSRFWFYLRMYGMGVAGHEALHGLGLKSEPAVYFLAQFLPLMGAMGLSVVSGSAVLGAAIIPIFMIGASFLLIRLYAQKEKHREARLMAFFEGPWRAYAEATASNQPDLVYQTGQRLVEEASLIDPYVEHVMQQSVRMVPYTLTSLKARVDADNLWLMFNEDYLVRHGIFVSLPGRFDNRTGRFDSLFNPRFYRSVAHQSISFFMDEIGQDKIRLMFGEELHSTNATVQAFHLSETTGIYGVLRALRDQADKVQVALKGDHYYPERFAGQRLITKVRKRGFRR